MNPLRLIFAGSGEFGLPTVRALSEAGHDIVQVVTQPDRPAGRGRTMTPTPIGAFASSRKFDVLKTANINAETLAPADLMIVIAFGQKIGELIVNHPRLGSINLHASLLPKYRGAAPINWAIIRGETVTGNSVIRLAQRMDAGDVLRQSMLSINELETAGELHYRLSADGAPLILNVVQMLASSGASETPQDDVHATLAPKLTRNDAAIDFTRPAEELARLIRGLYPWPGCRVEIVDSSGQVLNRVTLARARASHETADSSPGVAVEHGIAAGSGTSIEILELTPEGRQLMSLSAYQNGHPWRGSRIVSAKAD